MTKRYLLSSILVLTLAACANPLDVSNLNDPDRTRTFSNPQDLQVFIAGLYAVAHQATLGGQNDGLQTQMAVMSMENVSGLANFAMGPRGGIPRNPVSNQRGAQGNVGNYNDWLRGHRAARQAVLGIAALANLGTLGSPAADARARLFCRFVQGVALGNLALAYDSASILTEADNPQADAAVTVGLSGYRAVMTAALGDLDSAIALANANPTAFPFPVTANYWVNGIGVTQAQFIQIARSYKARFRANVARTPAERADTSRGGIVVWSEVIADANAGITVNFDPQMDRLNGWDLVWYAQHHAGAQWHQMSQFWLGMADTSGSYAAYLANTVPSTRTQILIVTPDRRFPQGTSRTAQNAAVGTGSAGQPFANTPYFRNRPSASDIAGDPLSVSMYDFWRGRAFQQALRVGRYPVMTAAEIRLLAAEGYLRIPTPNFLQAINRINVSRGDTVGGNIAGPGFLPRIPLTVVDTISVAVPGSAAGCVPKVPDAAQGYHGFRCGNIWDALKWEYRLETAYTGYGNWFFAGRGWGDLPQYTATQWPVPYNEMDARREAFYGFGGPGGASGAAPGNYGLFAPGGVY